MSDFSARFELAINGRTLPICTDALLGIAPQVLHRVELRTPLR
jgi:hypothetical protein